jgi:hypothetical protein
MKLACGFLRAQILDRGESENNRTRMNIRIEMQHAVAVIAS